ncbi:MAG TPA: hypothetical protein DDZ96_04735 [Porphyromonadaceae bacterium]|jgi:hypothetical protein|nr:hypothetical protein [Porphyromonadaceae bacterium]
MKKVFIAFLSLIVNTVFVISQPVQLSDAAKISLLTTSPWSGAIYSVYGHTAMQVEDDSTGVDAVFNYGYFDQSQPHFMYHFVRGETDYVLGVVPFDQFLPEYKQKGVEVIKQELNLTPQEKQSLWEGLYINSLPENRGYRYNYFFDNCSTRPRDMIEKYLNGTVRYPAAAKEQTFRDLLHECLHYYPWMEFGVDLLIGSDADKVADVRQKMFLPKYLMEPLRQASVVRNDTLPLPLVKNEITLLSAVNPTNADSGKNIFHPLGIAFVLLFLTIIISLVQWMPVKSAGLIKIYDTLLFGVFGIGGLIIFFLLFFSVHPATSPNWNFVWLNIFALIAAVLLWINSMRNVVYVYHFINFAVLTFFLILWWLIPQQLPVATIPFSMCLWMRSGANVFMRKKRIRKNKRFTTSKYMKAGWGQ